MAPAVPEQLQALHDALARFWPAVEGALPDSPSTEWRARFDTAVAEIGGNIVRHAHPAGAAAGEMRLTLRAFFDRVEAHFVDHGLAFNPDSTQGHSLDPPAAGAAGAPGAAGADTLDAYLTLAEHGRGLALVRASVDALTYTRSSSGENCWHLVKRLS